MEAKMQKKYQKFKSRKKDNKMTDVDMTRYNHKNIEVTKKEKHVSESIECQKAKSGRRKKWLNKKRRQKQKILN